MNYVADNNYHYVNITFLNTIITINFLTTAFLYEINN